MNVWTPARPTPAWTHYPTRMGVTGNVWRDLMAAVDLVNATPYGPGAFAAAPVAPADPDASLWPQAGAQPVLWAHDHTNPLGLRITVDPTLPPDRIELRPTPTRVEQLADLIAAHRPDWSYDGKRVGCTCGWWTERPAGQDVEVQHARHLATEIVALDRATVPPAWRDERLRARQEIEDLRTELATANRSIRELRECLAAAQADADSRSSVATTWRQRALDGYEKIGALQEELTTVRGRLGDSQGRHLEDLSKADEVRAELSSAQEAADQLRARIRELEADTQTCGRQREAATDEHRRLVEATRALLDDPHTTAHVKAVQPVLNALYG